MRITSETGVSFILDFQHVAAIAIDPPGQHSNFITRRIRLIGPDRQELVITCFSDGGVYDIPVIVAHAEEDPA